MLTLGFKNPRRHKRHIHVMETSTQNSSNMHLTRKESLMQIVKKFKVVELDDDAVLDETWMRVRDFRHSLNMLVDHGETSIERCVELIECFNTHTDTDVPVTVCVHCAKKFGIKRCAACPRGNGIRYCSRNCQLAHWPNHKSVCAALNEK